MVIALSSIVLLAVAGTSTWVAVVHGGDAQAALQDFQDRTGIVLVPEAEPVEAPIATAPAEVTTTSVASAEVSFTTKPEGVKVYLGEELLGTTPFAAELPEGPNLLRFDSKRHRDLFRVVHPEVGAFDLDIADEADDTEFLVEAIGFRDAQVRIDGEPVGAAPVVVDVDAGMHAIQVIPRGSAPLREDRYARKGAMTKVTFRR